MGIEKTEVCEEVKQYIAGALALTQQRAIGESPRKKLLPRYRYDTKYLESISRSITLGVIRLDRGMVHKLCRDRSS